MPRDHRTKLLSSPLAIGPVMLRNRFVMAPMDTGFETNPDGSWSERGIDYFARRARGGFALLYSGGFSVDHTLEGRPGTTFVENPRAFVSSSQRLIERTGAYGTYFFPQLAFGMGRNFGAPSPSPLPALAGGGTTRALTTEEIEARIDELVQGAVICREAGFRGIDIHALHWGHLLDQFALAYMNHRDDEYGGDLEHRLAIPRILVERIKRACGEDFVVTMRLALKSYLAGFGRGSVDGADEVGRTPEEAVEVVRLLRGFGYDALSCDTGTCDSLYYGCPPSYVPKGYDLPFARMVKRTVDVPVLLASRMNDLGLAEQALADGDIDAVALGRPSLADPDLPNKVFAGREDRICPCLSCNQGCIGRYSTVGSVSCAVNPAVGMPEEYGLAPAELRRHVVVVGGGAAGMEAAIVAARRGHEVTLLEKSDRLGGLLTPAGTHGFKREVLELRDWLASEVAYLPIEVRLGEEASAEGVCALGADAVILSVGSVPVMPHSIKGINHPKVRDSISAVMDEGSLGRRVAIVGGGLVGCELALDLAQQGREVTVVEALDEALMGPGIPAMNRQFLLDSLERLGVPLLTGHRLERVDDRGAVVADATTGNEELVEADDVVIAIGFRPRPSLRPQLEGAGCEVYEVGDGNHVGSIMTAMWQAYEVARAL